MKCYHYYYYLKKRINFDSLMMEEAFDLIQIHRILKFEKQIFQN